MLSYPRAGHQASLAGSIHPAHTPGGARAADCSQCCRFSSHGAGPEGFAAPQDMARSEATPAPGGQRRSVHSQPEGHVWDHVPTLLWPPGCGTRSHRQDSWPARPVSTILPALLVTKGRGWPRKGAVGVGCGRDRLWLPRVYRHNQQPCPGRQGLKPSLFIATTQLGLHLLITSCCSIPSPLCNSPQQHHQTGPSARCARTRANRIWLAACCLLPCACSSLPVAQHPAVPS